MYEWVLGYLKPGFFSLSSLFLSEFIRLRLIVLETPDSVLQNTTRPIAQSDLRNVTRHLHSSLPS